MLCRRGSPERCVFAPIRLSRPRPDSPQVLSLALREDYVSIDCVGAEAADQTHDAIEQACVVHSLEHSLIALHAALLAEMAANPTDSMTAIKYRTQSSSSMWSIDGMAGAGVGGAGSHCCEFR